MVEKRITLMDVIAASREIRNELNGWRSFLRELEPGEKQAVADTLEDLTEWLRDLRGKPKNKRQ